jgi:hypothetical protein
VVSPGVPGELADEPVVLVEVVPGMGEDHVGVEPAFQVLEHVLHLATAVRKEPVAKAVDNHIRVGRSVRERLSARPCLALPLAVGAEDHPRDLEFRTRPA